MQEEEDEGLVKKRGREDDSNLKGSHGMQEHVRV